MPVNPLDLWQFDNPAASLATFQEAQVSADSEDWAILQTQVARAKGLLGNFEAARVALEEIDLEHASIEVQVRYWLELGRTQCSPKHKIEARTMEAKASARTCYQQAFELAQHAKLDYLAIDALHMMTVVDDAPEDQLQWNMRAIEYMESALDPLAKRWAGSLYNNTGYALALAGRHDEAELNLQKALAERETHGNPSQIRVAKWMIAWNLRLSGKAETALRMQLDLEKECDEVGEPDPYVFDELELIYLALDRVDIASAYKTKADRVRETDSQ